MKIETKEIKNPIIRWIHDGWSLLVGLSVTLKYSFKKTSTLRYPQKTRTYPKNVKGPIRFVYFEKTNTHDCIACNLCLNICPSNCFEIKGGKQSGAKRRPYYFTLDYSVCSLCTLCVEVCPTHTLEHSDDVAWASRNRQEFTMDFIQDTTDFRQKLGLEPSEPRASQKTPPPSFQPPPAPQPSPEPPKDSPS